MGRRGEDGRRQPEGQPGDVHLLLNGHRPSIDLTAEIDTYFAHDHKVHRFVLSGEDPWPRFDPLGVLAHPAGPAAVMALGARARSAAWRNVPDGSDLHEVLRGVPLSRERLDSALGARLAADLLRCGVLLQDGRLEQWNLGFGVAALGGALVVVPRDPAGPDQVYLGPEVLWLERWRAELGLDAEHVVELGAGSGVLATVLAAAGRQVVATDLLARAAAMTRLSLLLHGGGVDGAPDGGTGPTLVVRADVGRGLAPGRADLVVANPPWVPDPPAAVAGAAVVFRAGGPTGCELPLRFLADGMALLRPGGVLLLTTLDPVLADGRRPIAAAVADMPSGFTGYRIATPFRRRHAAREADFLAAHPQLRRFDHVVLAVRRLEQDPESCRGPEGADAWSERCAAVAERLRPEGWTPNPA